MITIDKDSSSPIYRQIEVKLKNKILREELTYGTRLPSERRLAEMLSINRNTVVKAYKLLSDQGLVSCEIEGKKGYFVVFRSSNEEEENGKGRKAVFDYSGYHSVYEKNFLEIYNASFDPSCISFGGHILPDELVELENIKKIIEKVTESYGVSAFSYCSPKGHPLLRRQLARSLQEEGINVAPAEVAIINETTQGLEYICHILTKEGDFVATEYPVMPETYAMFKQHGLNVLTVDIEEDGVNLEALSNLFKAYKVKFFHTMPDYHAVTGCRMSLEKRKKLLSLAYKQNVPVVEERWFSGVDFNSDKLPSLYAMDKRKNVIIVDNLISRFYYGAKIGLLAAPFQITERIGRTVSGSQSHLQSLEQLMLVEYLKEGYDKVQREHIRNYYAHKHELMEGAMEKLKKIGLSWKEPLGGLGIWCKLPKGIKDVELYKDLRREGVIICPGKWFFPGGSDERQYIRLSFSNVSDDKIEEGIRIIYDSIKGKLK